MNTHADKTQENKSQSVANDVFQKQSGGESTFQFVDNRPEAVTQRKIQTLINNHSASSTIEKKENNTGLPDNLKSGIENLSSYSMDGVKVHYNSDKPAQLQAHAYTQGSNIYIAPGQNKHLPHEAWHVVQQKQGRVKPTTQMKGRVDVNDDRGLEKEANMMGSKALSIMNEESVVKHSIPKQFKNDYNIESSEQRHVVQAQFTPQSRKHLGHDDPATEWLDETIGNVVMERSNNMNYTKTDGDNSGSIKHYVPYNWIMKNIADKYVIGYKRHTVVANLVGILKSLGLEMPGSYPENPADFDALIRDSVYLICDWEENLFKHLSSSGDGGGTKLDTPNDPGVLARVQAAQTALGNIANPPL